MGLDIAIKVFTSRQDETLSYYELSRTFCRLICDLSEMKDDVPALTQLFEICEVNGSVIKNASGWEMDRTILYESDPDLTSVEIETYYDQCWQPSKDILVLLKTMYEKIESDPSILHKIQFHYDWIRNYFDDFDIDRKSYTLDKNFEWELRNLVKYLSDLEPDSKVRFHFF